LEEVLQEVLQKSNQVKEEDSENLLELNSNSEVEEVQGN
jgi:hypothetical protein